ncbi:hypothetical protein HanRHA438_Chr17g0800031 [Helianthus annuus]|nr:hypothetical protein HanRHA438_Chr17g0800031 [Helianthus annuus]
MKPCLMLCDLHLSSFWIYHHTPLTLASDQARTISTRQRFLLILFKGTGQISV